VRSPPGSLRPRALSDPPGSYLRGVRPCSPIPGPIPGTGVREGLRGAAENLPNPPERGMDRELVRSIIK
jgi:hypothetical protein